MKVNIDLNHSFSIGGIANFKRNLAIRLMKSPELQIIGCYNWSRQANKEKYIWFKGPLKESIVPNQLVYKRAYDYWYSLPISYEAMMQSTADFNLFLTFDLPRVKFQKPVIATIHDIILLKAKTESKAFTEQHEQILRETIKKSRHLLTVSESAKLDIVDYFNVNPDTIDIVHNGLNQNQFANSLTKEKKAAIIKKYGLPECFILYFGGYRVHKNIERLLQAYALLSPVIRKDLKLVITNKDLKLQALASELKINADTTFTSFIDEEDKCALYQSAEMVYYASLYEGFGVPVLEAQISKIPVITSTTSSLPEASGGYAELVNPYSVDEIYQAILHLHNDNNRREYLIENGFNNAIQYTWERGANELQKALNKII